MTFDDLEHVSQGETCLIGLVQLLPMIQDRNRYSAHPGNWLDAADYNGAEAPVPVCPDCLRSHIVVEQKVHPLMNLLISARYCDQ